ncbi:hypothetical protein TBLA_0D02640 [Henningerozyma blattae CBS 6284]|uniref:Proteasome activator Blm10 mid region domain-containing protein n=1 Tax=Henningerozyma blattae (strain ATCC 34711 / CBS 6284 / DSM 70876 / NBRC 10599 / NRRL Y-10934 / UCD 77-7) TaxID=1071380 RepID=I2H315_HENB6|nr:hypothetical protein TBLA_0D02640 [Tetrapisispora blattae CBS 6284]CCH60767.1 hypothetical protein TBLA_0D02640 [Tetrapisispora blattae CBS 6284]
MKHSRNCSDTSDSIPKRFKIGTAASPIATINGNEDINSTVDYKTLQKSSRSQSPLKPTDKLWNAFNSERLLKERLAHYGLDYVKDPLEHYKNIFDKNSKWYSRAVKPLYMVNDCMPYKTESHLDQARYLCHVMVNLYISISSLDIQGLISISSKELSELKNEINDFLTHSDMPLLTQEMEAVNNDIADYDEGEEDDDEFDIFEDNEYIDSIGPDFNATGKITSRSATIINVNHWTNELKNCLHFDFPLTLRKSLATVYYYLSLVQGQKIYRQLHVEIFTSLVTIDDEGTDFTEELINIGLVLDHKLLVDFLCVFLPYPDSDYVKYEITSKEDLQLFRVLLKLSHNAKAFFDKTSTRTMKDLMDRLLSSLSPSTMTIVLPMITSSVPYHYNSEHKIIDYFPFFYSFWSSVSANITIDTHIYDFAGNIAEDAHWKLLKGVEKDEFFINFKEHFNQFGLFTDEQMTFMFNRLQGHLRTDGQIHSYSRTARPFVFGLNGSNNKMYFEKLLSLTRSIETFVHPSNSGFWTKPIAKFVHSFTKMYHKRAKKEEQLEIKHELCLTPECHTKIVDMFLEILTVGAQNKNSEIANFYISALAYLLDLKPQNSNLLFERVLIDMYESLSGDHVNSRHRIISALKRFTRTVRYLVMNKLYRVHIMNILLMLVNKIDINDVNLTSNIFNCIVSIASFVPFIKMVKEDEYITFESNTLPFIAEHFEQMKSIEITQSFVYDDEILDKATRASTTIFDNIFLVYVDKIFQLVDIDLDDGLVTKINQTTMLMLESMDDSTFNLFSRQLQRKFWDNDSFRENEPNYELVTVPMSALVKRTPKLCEEFFDMLSFNVKEQIQKGAGSIRSSTEIQQRDVKLVLYLMALNDIFRQSHESLLKFSDKLMEFFHFVYESITNPPIDVVSSILVHSALSTLTNTEIKTCRMFPENCVLPIDEMWGGMQFDNRKFQKQYLTFDWHIPSEDEATLAINIFETLTNYCITSIDRLLEGNNLDPGSPDEIQKYILIVTHAISGCSLLFDPDFNNVDQRSQEPETITDFTKLRNERDLKSDTPDLNVEYETPLTKNEDTEYIDSQFSDESPDMVEFKDTIDLVMEDTDPSQAPSGINTPAIGDSNGTIDDLPFRDLDIYTCNYFFGSTSEQKCSHPNYYKVHELKARVGFFFHKMCKYLSSNFENNTSVYRILLHGLKVWFTDVGQETIFNNDISCFLDLEFLENIQSLSNLQEPFTTTCLAIRANTFHQSRVLLKSTNRRPSKLEALLLRDVIDLATSVYPDVHKPAQGTLVHCMKQLVGSYSIIVNILLPSLETKLSEADFMSIQVILKVLMIKKIHRKLHTDYKNFEKLLNLLLECCKINEQDISLYSEKLLNEVINGVKIPSSVCIIDDRAFDPILTPPDESVAFQVKLIKRAKDNKRENYITLLSSIESKMVTVLNSEEEISWKIAMMMMRFVTRIQSSLETKADKNVIAAIHKQTLSKHPHIIHLAVKSFLGIFNKLFSLNDYDYDISRSSLNTFDPKYINKMETKSIDFNKKFKAEMNNFNTPKYFIDNRAFVGWLCWGSPMKVMKPEQIEIKLTENDTEVMKAMGHILTKEWLVEMTTSLLQDNETRSVFSSGNVSFFILIISLIANSVCDLPLSCLFDLCKKYYDRYDKASMITSVEIFSALIVSSKFMTNAMIKQRNDFVDEFLPDCLENELNHDAFEIWATVAWWVPTVVDIRRCPPFYYHFSKLNKLLDTNSDAASHQANKILMFRGVLTTLEFKTPDVNPILNDIVFYHPYDQVRESIAKLFTTLLQNASSQSSSSPDNLLKITRNNSNGLGIPVKFVPEFMEVIIKQQFIEIVKESATLVGLSPQDILKTKFYYLSSTMYYWIKEMTKGPNRVLLVPFLYDCVAPFLMELMKHKDVCKLADVDPTPLYASLAYMPYRKEHLSNMINLICDTTLTSTAYQIRVQLSFVQHFFSAQLLQLSSKHRDDILSFVVHNLYDPNHLEVRMKAADVLSDIVHNLGQSNKFLHGLIKKFNKNLGTHTWQERKELSKSDIKIHGSVVGLGAIISAFPYVFPLPRWIPEQLSTLSSWARTSGIAGSSAKTTISEFKKVRTDTWQFDRAVFTNEELEDLEGVLWRSYYA